VEYVSRAPRPPLDGLIDDIYYLAGAPPYARLTLPPAPAALLIVNLGAPFRIRGGADAETGEYADVGGQVFAAGLVDEVRMDVVPVVFGSGKRFFGSVDARRLLEDPDEVIQGNRVFDLRYRVRR
jgi:hypothetical protein